MNGDTGSIRASRHARHRGSRCARYRGSWCAGCRGSRRTGYRGWRGVGYLVVTAAVAVLATACAGGASSPAGSASGGSARYQQALAYSECMRSHGVLNFPDPDAAGNIIQHVAAGQPTGDTPQEQKADNACHHLLPWWRHKQYRNAAANHQPALEAGHMHAEPRGAGLPRPHGVQRDRRHQYRLPAREHHAGPWQRWHRHQITAVPGRGARLPGPDTRRAVLPGTVRRAGQPPPGPAAARSPGHVCGHGRSVDSQPDCGK